ncbi:MAG: hypothetical protein JJE30_09840 [Desulfuromonadales bacterium]|nr:hypothetical protein [Desulfuromonadales bacterium]
MKKGFFAYSSQPSSCSDAIESAITEINKSGLVNLMSWQLLNVNGVMIINEILKQIDDSDFFCADLTGINDNVLFELGYAIGKNKPIWLLLDTSHTDSVRRNRELGFFSSIGYDNYTNSQQIVTAFYKNQPYDKGGALDSLLERANITDFDQPLLFLKNQVDTNYNLAIQNAITNLKLSFCLDDAIENKVNNLVWYLTRLIKLPAVIAELSTIARTGYEIQNSKCATISGIAVGMGLKVLMVCEEPYYSPLDYRELLAKYSNSKDCIAKINPFLQDFKNEYFQLKLKKNQYSNLQHNKKLIQRLDFGEFLAEHEGENITRYYVETMSSSSLIKSEYNIVVGRKGCGKTATMYYLKGELESNKANFVCTIKPISYELEGLIDVMKNVPKEFEKTYLIESVWKLLIYTEIARSIYEGFQRLPSYSITNPEQEYIQFIENNDEIFLADLHSRIVEKLTEIISTSATSATKESDFKIRVSELLHQNVLGEIKKQIFKIFPKGKNIYILIDNLDKSWKDNNSIEFQCRWLLSLLGVTGRIIRDFSSNNTGPGIRCHLTIFLRSDIFRHVMLYAREPDKIEYSKLIVDDKETLFRIIEERFSKLNNDIIPSELWDTYLPKVVYGEDIKDYIYKRIIPRPRDIIFYFIKMKEIAVLRGHASFLESDVAEAHKQYSEWVFSSLIVENGVSIKQMEDFLYELVGEHVVIGKDEIISRARSAQIIFENESDIEHFIDHLVALSILGRETKQDEFLFDYSLENNKKNKALARKLGSNRYKIHDALIPELGCT